MKYTNHQTENISLRFVKREAGPEQEITAPATNGETVDIGAVTERLGGIVTLDASDFPQIEGRQIAALGGQLEAIMNDSGGAFAQLRNSLNAFGETDLGSNGANLFTMLQSLLAEMGFDIDDESTSGGTSSGTGTPNAGPNGPMAEVPPNEEMPELDETPSAADMAMLRSRSGSADVDNMTNPAKNIAIETLRAHPNLTVTSGYRDPERNRRAGGVPNSDHITGNAINFGTIDPAVSRWVEAAFPGQVYTLIHGNRRNPNPTHLHVSYRPGGQRVA